MSTMHLKTPKVQATMQKVGAIMADRLAPLFKSDALVTVIVRFPDNDEADFFMSDRQESIAELRRFLERCDKRDQLDCTDGVLAADANDEDPHVMSALNSGVPRADAIQEAIAAGKQARDDGKPRTANPYKRDGERTLWHPWDIGWCRTQAEEDADLGVIASDGSQPHG